jgi:hypothetical protein
MASPRPPKIEVHQYLTPTERTRGCPQVFSLGILNLTEEEAREVARFATGLRAKMEKRAVLMTDAQPAERFTPGEWDRLKYLVGDRALPWGPQRVTDDRDDIEREAARQPEPEEPRNRFSGLDLE